MATLTRDKTCWYLLASKRLVLGRQDALRAGIPGAELVSREQVALELESRASPAQQVRLTSLGRNPTLVIRGGGEQQEPHELIYKGHSALLADGHSFALLPTHGQAEAIQVNLPQQQQQQQQEKEEARQMQQEKEEARQMQQTPPQTEASVAAAGASKPPAAAAGDTPGGSCPAAAADAGTTPSRGKRPRTPSTPGQGSPAADAAAGDGDLAPGARSQSLSQSLSQPSGSSQQQPPKRARKAGSAKAEPLTADPSLPPMPSGMTPLMLILVGPPGSGKSTFSQSLIKRAPVPWYHVNQDSIRNGSPGTREQCLAKARAALSLPACCIIDRCNFDTDQRGDFLDLARRLGARVHAVVLMPPAEVCVRRATARTDHPSGVQGHTAGAVVMRFYGLIQKDSLSQQEGLESIMRCSSDAEAHAALSAWCHYGAVSSGSAAGGKPLPAGGSGGNGATAAAGSEQGAAGGGGAGGVAASGQVLGADAVLSYWKDHKPTPKGTLLSFFQPAKKAAAAAPAAAGTAKKAAAGAGAAGKQAPERAPAAAAAAAKASVAAPTSGAGGEQGDEPPAAKRRRTAAGSVDPAAAGGGSSTTAQPRVAAAGGANQSSGAAAAAAAAVTAVACLATAAAAVAAPAPIDAPAQAPAAPAAAAATTAARAADPAAAAVATASAGKSGKDAFSVLMSARKSGAPAPAAAAGGASHQPAPAAASPKLLFNFPGARALRDMALNPSLIRAADQPDAHVDEQCIRILDKFPKSRFHALVVARDPALHSLYDLHLEHLPLLAHMREVGEAWARQAQEAAGLTGSAAPQWRLGLHSVPSMEQLHVHVISQDFVSECMKKKLHYNSFTTKFFLPLSLVEEQLRTHGQVHVDRTEMERLTKQDMSCHRCGTATGPNGKPFNMPSLKAHLELCKASVEAPDVVKFA